MNKLLLAAFGASGLLAGVTQAQNLADAEARARAVEARMTDDERVVMTHGFTPNPSGNVTLPADAVFGAGYIAGIPRLNIPSLTETDASLGVAWSRNVRRDDGATPLPAGLAQASTWNRALVREAGAMIGAEAKAKGFNVLLAGGANLIREPRNSRAFEYLSEDPLLTGVLAGEAIAGIQSNRMISTVKHFAFNDQETGRKEMDARIADGAARESDLLAFQLAIERGKPGAVMCAYNRVNGPHSCDNDYLLNQVLKRDWGFKGFVMSDWGAVTRVGAALNGLDQQSGQQRDAAVFLGEPLKQAAAFDPAYAARLRDMNRRILYAIYANGLDTHPPLKKPLDFNYGLAVAEKVAQQGIVLLRNEQQVLPLAASVKRIAVIGGFADAGVLAGGGSSEVHMKGGPAVVLPLGAESATGFPPDETYHRSAPLKAIRARAQGIEVSFSRALYASEAAAAAQRADVAIVFATSGRGEGEDVPDLSLPRGQDALIAAVAEANPNTIVVLQSGGAVVMPWLEKTAAVLQAWYPGGRGAEAIAAVLFGDVNPSGHLPITFPASLAQLPRPRLDGADAPQATVAGGGQFPVNYDIEGSDVGYRWNARRAQQALFPFGFGLSYTRFESTGLTISGPPSGLTARFIVRNVGSRPGAEVAQLYLVARPGGPKQRLVGFERIELQPGEQREVVLEMDARLLADWRDSGWALDSGAYQFALGENAEVLGPAVSVRLAQRQWR